MYFRAITPKGMIYSSSIDITAGRAIIEDEADGKKFSVRPDRVEVSFNDPDIWYKLSDLKRVFL